MIQKLRQKCGWEIYRTNKGFTLIELLIVCMIICILIGIVVPRMIGIGSRMTQSNVVIQTQDSETVEMETPIINQDDEDSNDPYGRDNKW